jgi:hypothetical protein
MDTEEDNTMPRNDDLKPTEGVVGIAQNSNCRYFVSVIKQNAANSNRFFTTSHLMLDFVFDHQRGIIGLGYNTRENKLGHDGIATKIGVPGSLSGEDRLKKIVGGRISFKDNALVSAEWSGHYGHLWTPEIRDKFTQLLKSLTGLDIQHCGWESEAAHHELERSLTPSSTGRDGISPARSLMSQGSLESLDTNNNNNEVARALHF